MILSIFFINCNSIERDIDIISELKAIEENKDVKVELTANNDDISFKWLFSYDLLNGKKNTLNTFIYSSEEYRNQPTQQKLQKENKYIQNILKREMKSFSNIDKINFYLMQEGIRLDSLSVNLRN